MEDKYKIAIKAGAIGAIVLIAISLCITLTNGLIGGKGYQQEMQRWAQQYSNPQATPTGMPELPSSIMGTFMLILVIQLVLMALLLVVYLGIGVLAARDASVFVKSTGDAALVGAVAGAVAEVLHRIVTSVFDFIIGLILPLGAASTISDSITAFFNQFICCLPVMLVVGIVLAVIGAVAYAMIRKPQAT